MKTLQTGSKMSSFLVVALVVFFTSGIADAGLYEIFDLGTLGGNESEAFDINNQGQVVGRSKTGLYDSHFGAFIWDENNKMKELGYLREGSWSRAFGINDNGLVVGEAVNTVGLPHAFIWQNGTMHDLDTRGNNFLSDARDINNLGEVVGTFSTVEGVPAIDPGGGFSFSGSLHGYIWDEKNEFQDLTPDRDGQSIAHGINDKGQVIGTMNTPFLYDPNQGIEIIENEELISAKDINNNGDILGFSRNFSDPYEARILDENDNVVKLGLLDGEPLADESNNWGINDNGQVVGWTGEEVFIWDEENGKRDLNGLFSSDRSWNLVTATSINNNGQIVGSGYVRDGNIYSKRAYFLNPINGSGGNGDPNVVPEPATMLLLGVGLLGAGVIRKRRS